GYSGNWMKDVVKALVHHHEGQLVGYGLHISIKYKDGFYYGYYKTAYQPEYGCTLFLETRYFDELYDYIDKKTWWKISDVIKVTYDRKQIPRVVVYEDSIQWSHKDFENCPPI